MDKEITTNILDKIFYKLSKNKVNYNKRINFFEDSYKIKINLNEYIFFSFNL